jgi:enamine deaminase RidA (YjgF/YER057c/UK114 family)
MTLRFINPPTLPQTPGYTQVVEATGARTVHISGQVALDTAGNLVGPGDLHAQTQQVFANIQAALESVGASFNNVAKLTYFVLDATQMPIVREVRDQYVNRAQPPASSAFEVRRLVGEGFLIEVEAIAVLAS